MKRDIWPADRKYLDYTERTQAGIRFTCPYDILMNRLRSRITDFYDKLTPAQQALEAFGQSDEQLKKIAGQFQKQWEASKNATVKAVLREMDLQIMQNKDAKAVISHMSNVLKKRMASQAQLLQAATGQLQQYMVLWKYQDMGCTHYRFYAEGENCADCAELHGRVFPISEALSGTNFPPMHPNCNCRAEILDAQGNAVYTVSGGAEAATLHQSAWYDGLLRIPQDAKELLTGLIRSQDERFWNIQDPLTLLDWLTFGMLSTNGQRAVVAQQNPNFYTIGNWLTMGLFDTVKGAFQPEEPFSLQHWLDSFGTASLLISAYSMAKAAAPSAGTVNYADDAAAVAVKKAGDALDDVPAGRKGAAGSNLDSKIYSPVEYKGTVKINGTLYNVSRKVYQRNDIDINFFDKTTGMTNIERMQIGKPPIGPDNNPIQLHHILQKEAGTMVEIQEMTHQQYYSQLHGLIGNGTSFRNNPLLKKQYNNFRYHYWKWRAEQLTGGE